MAADSNTKRAFLKGVILSIAFSAILALGLARTRAGEWLENGSRDVRSRWTAQPAKADPRIVIIDIDNASLSTLQEKLGRWPWTRRVWTEVIRYVSLGKPSAIVVDAIFGGEENNAVDSEFAKITKESGKVVLGFTFLSTKLERANESPDQNKQELLEAHASKFGLREGLGEVLPEDQFEAHLPLEKLADAAAGLGCLNASEDLDGVVRSVPLQYQFRGRAYDSLALRGVQLASPQKPLPEWHKREGLFDSNYLVRTGLHIPVDDQGRMLLLWRGDAKVYPRLPIWEVICSIYSAQCPNAEHNYPPDYFHDKIVLIGASATASSDVHPTPFSAVAPGFIAHATAMDNLLNAEALHAAPFWLLTISVVAMASLGGLLQLHLRSIALGAAILCLLLALYFGGALVIFRNLHFVLPVIAPCLGLIASFGASTVARYVTTGRELRRTRGVLDRYVAPQLVDYVMSNLEKIHLNGDKRQLTILISDVRNFTTMTEKSEPMELISLLDDYLAAMTEIIFKYNGIVDKFIGDGILAYWGAFTPGTNHAQEASQAALEMIERVEQLNQQWAKQGKGPIAIGIGINTGSVIFGNIGRGKKIEFTVIGDAVNLAARLEGLNKEFHTSIIVSEFTLQMLGDAAKVRPLGGVKVKGKTIETTVFELQSMDLVPSTTVPSHVTPDSKTRAKSVL